MYDGDGFVEIGGVDVEIGDDLIDDIGIVFGVEGDVACGLVLGL